ncbi:MAG: MBL fold metallo-hydrolase [Actinobacteria bacterium]|nr:MBL fold metallo-hydrolase [Actinomycetota bacterium]MCB9412437.1 MBL fold metallo-hydrolase [Actinomycetota bacterium]
MFVSGFPAGPWGTNCFVVAEAPGSECLIIDPGMDAMARVDEIVADNRLKVAAVVLTHGHLDHTWSVFGVCESAQVPAYIHSDDRVMLADPAVGFLPEMVAAVRSMTGGRFEFAEPDDVEELTDGGRIDILGVSLGVRHTPGHTPGSAVFTHPGGDGMPPLLFSGDLLFAGSIGRTDLPGGDSIAMMRSLSTALTSLTDDTVVLPGHGPQTTMAQERATNPFLTGQASL